MDFQRKGYMAAPDVLFSGRQNVSNSRTTDVPVPNWTTYDMLLITIGTISGTDNNPRMYIWLDVGEIRSRIPLTSHMILWFDRNSLRSVTSDGTALTGAIGFDNESVTLRGAGSGDERTTASKLNIQASIGERYLFKIYGWKY